eukprot:TRINITY_DN5345_c0_g1_i3.p1 TRINITY_DN5345_c0_g1~~TRINITY_DN5345_c0_g1_i3.p1  ORF type:complete len:254 (+),score=37.54 TRINITY_DN5345_c0_g1_i3:121-882(+)
MCIRDSFATTSILEVLKAMEHQKDLAFDPYFVVQLPHNTADFSKAALFVYVRIDDSELLRDLQSHFAKLADVTIDNACALVGSLRLKLERSADSWEEATNTARDHEFLYFFLRKLSPEMTEFPENLPSFRSPGYDLLSDFPGKAFVSTVRQELLRGVDRARATAFKLSEIEARFHMAETLAEKCHEHASTNGAFEDPAGRECGKLTREDGITLYQKDQSLIRFISTDSYYTFQSEDDEGRSVSPASPRPCTPN